ncbi:MAG TPA: AAA family ATPase [bacterium]|nr:AAA family ATPase [bacterium]
MRLVRLAMRNIGPYVGDTVIDFSSLGDVFLICGKTGSGKTTIFDAITYALYGSARSARDVVSQYAGSDDEVMVDLEFLVGRQRWRIVRKPARTVPKKRGPGTTERPSEVSLSKYGAHGWSSMTDKAGEVEASITRVIGLSATEFTKIVLLPQGEFQQFLEMNTGERTTILEKLFPVASHAAVMQLARDHAREAEALARDLDARIGTSEGALGEAPERLLEDACTRCMAARNEEASALAALDAAKALANAARQAERAWAEYDAAANERDALARTAAQATSEALRTARAEAAVGAQAPLEAARAARSALAESERALAAASERLAACDRKAAEIADTTSRLADMGTQLEAMDREAGLLGGQAIFWDRLAAAEHRAAVANARLTELEATRAAAMDNVTVASGRLAGLQAAAADQEQLEAARAAADGSVREARESLRLGQEHERYELEVGALRQRLELERVGLETARATRIRALAELAEAEAAVEALRDERAAIRLSHRLVPGQPCPVCGSVDHPGMNARAAMSDEPGDLSDTGTALDAALSRSRDAVRAAERDEAAGQARHGEVEHALSARVAAAPSRQDGLAVAVAAERLGSAQSLLAEAEEALRREAARGRAVDIARNELDGLQSAVAIAVSELGAVRVEASAATAAAAEARNGCGDADPRARLAELQARRAEQSSERARLEALGLAWQRERAEALTRLAEAQSRLAPAHDANEEAALQCRAALLSAGFDDEDAWEAARMAPADLESARESVRERAALEAASGARWAAALRAVDGLARPDAAGTESALAAAQAAYAAARTGVDEAVRAEREVRAGLDELARLRLERQNLRVRGDRLVAMARLLNGETDGRHLSFKNYVLASYFALVVERASVRLREMSDGRYDMRVAEGRAAGRGHVGLDLSVLDAYTGVARPASSLSGGEKFLASISLALGLSEVIVSRAGGISLDSIFIDEGFGSLDEETLDRAMIALDRVRGERVIGIVSHVAELRDRVPARIEVAKSTRGSTLRVVS